MKHNIIISKPGKTVKGTVQLTGSKSECNRALVIEALSEGRVKVENISDAADTVTLAGILRGAASQKSEVKSQNLSGTEDLLDVAKTSELLDDPKLIVGTDEVNEVVSIETKTGKNSPLTTHNSQLATENSPLTVDIGPAGTAMRFLTAYYAIGEQEVILTGSERMKQRPIGVLVDALRTLGANISYEGHEGYPPIRLKGNFTQQSRKISIKGDISSQYITALLLIAAKLPLGLELHIEGELTSRPYVEMTLTMLRQAGIEHRWTDDVIEIDHQLFGETSLYTEPDWSAASYWYAIAALSDEADLFLPGLTPYSLQGDSVIGEIMANFGITSVFKDGGVHVSKEPKPIARKVFDMKECPDLAQTVIVVCAALGHEATFTGLETLKIKETDRVLALQTELAKMGVKLVEKGQVYKLDCSERFVPERMFVNTYDDHRMAMAFAPLATIIPVLEIEDADVVEKSYPAFWKDLESVGFSPLTP